MDSVRARAIDASSLCLVVQVPASTSPRLQPRVRCSPEAAGFASSSVGGSSQSARRALHIAPLRRRLRRRLGGGRTVVSDDEDDFVDVNEEHLWPSRRGRDDMDDRDDDDEEEDEEEGHDEYEKDGFIVDDADEEEEEEEEQRESDDERWKKKKRKKRELEEFMLDEDDYMLLQDNNIHGIQRPKPGTKFKRFKKVGKEFEMDDRSGFSDDDGSGKKCTAEERVHSSLFGDHQDVSFEEDIVEEDQQVEEDEVGEDDDEMAYFIVDEEEIDVNGQIIRRQQVKRKPIRQAAGVSSSALQEAHDIFGDVDELLALRKQELERDVANSGELRGKRLEDEFEPFILA